ECSPKRGFRWSIWTTSYGSRTLSWRKPSRSTLFSDGSIIRELMVQLRDDCFSVGTGLMPVEDAIALIAERLPILAGTETVALMDADGRIAAEDSLAQCD